MVKTKRTKSRRIVQGDIIRKVDYVEAIVEKSGLLEISRIEFPLVVVLTQDCDLEQDYRFRWSHEAKSKSEDKWLLSVLVAPIYNLEHIYTGEHLSELGMKMEAISRSKTPGKNLKSNQNPRYHYLDFGPDVPIVPSVIDFKHYFSVSVQYLRKVKREKFICQLSPLFREDVSQRFASFLARIGLPE
jgi:hypothetical protein